MNELVKIDGIELTVKEYQNQVIMTSWDIAKMHERDFQEASR